ncbi:MAG: hypothetical protein IJ598_09300 [Ruminococcus sp.]|nr:hypothetical protein [Ruminococcus sp.]
MSQSVIHLQCESCGGELTIDAQQKLLVCPFCGSKELILDSDAVAVEKIRQQTAFRQWEREDNAQKEQKRSAYRNSKAGIVSLVFAVICGCWCVGCFASVHSFFRVLNGIVCLLQLASFLLSYLERKEVIHLQKRFHLGNIKLPSLLMAIGFLLFIPLFILSAL